MHLPSNVPGGTFVLKCAMHSLRLHFLYFQCLISGSLHWTAWTVGWALSLLPTPLLPPPFPPPPSSSLWVVSDFSLLLTVEIELTFLDLVTPLMTVDRLSACCA